MSKYFLMLYLNLRPHCFIFSIHTVFTLYLIYHHLNSSLSDQTSCRYRNSDLAVKLLVNKCGVLAMADLLSQASLWVMLDALIIIIIKEVMTTWAATPLINTYLINEPTNIVKFPEKRRRVITTPWTRRGASRSRRTCRRRLMWR